MKRDEVILVRGGGDLATGTIHRLWSAGLKVLVLEAEQPAAIRRQVSVSEAPSCRRWTRPWSSGAAAMCR